MWVDGQRLAFGLPPAGEAAHGAVPAPTPAAPAAGGDLLADPVVGQAAQAGNDPVPAQPADDGPDRG
eukprot:11671235-Alexandrium_andersonii.AAC.1